jgi:hypothetical protein
MGVTTGSLKLGNVWKVVREVDLDAIRREALAPFDLAILGEPVTPSGCARRARGAGAPHRFIRVNPPGGGATIPNAVIVVTGTGPAIHRSRQHPALPRRSTHPARASVLDGDNATEAVAQAAAAILGALPTPIAWPSRTSCRRSAPRSRTHHRGHRPRQRLVRVHVGAGGSGPDPHRTAQSGRHDRPDQEPAPDGLSAGARLPDATASRRS